MHSHVDKGQQLYVTLGAQGGFSQAWVILNHDLAKFNEPEMRQFGKIMFGTIPEMMEAYPQVNGVLSLKEFRRMFGTYTIVGKMPALTRGPKLTDISREGLIDPVTGHTLFCHSLTDEDFGRLMDIN